MRSVFIFHSVLFLAENTPLLSFSTCSVKSRIICGMKQKLLFDEYMLHHCCKVWLRVYCVHFSNPSERHQKISTTNICFSVSVLLEEVTCELWPTRGYCCVSFMCFHVCLRSSINNSLSPCSFFFFYRPQCVLSIHWFCLIHAKL